MKEIGTAESAENDKTSYKKRALIADYANAARLPFIEVRKIAAEMDELLAPFLGQNNFSTLLYEHAQSYRLIIAPIPETNGHRVVPELFKKLEAMPLIQGLGILSEDFVLRFENTAQLTLLMDLIRHEPALNIPQEHVAEPETESGVFWNTPAPQTPADYASSLLVGLSRFQMGCSNNIDWQFEVRGDITVFKPVVYESETRDEDVDNVMRVLMELGGQEGIWDGVFLSYEPIAIHVENFGNFARMLEAYADASGFKYGIKFLEDLDITGCSEKGLQAAEDALKGDPSLLQCLKGRAYVSERDLLLNAVKLIYAADSGKFACPYEPKDILKAMAKERSLIVPSLSADTPTLGQG